MHDSNDLICDVAVVGAGHAGCEAALAAARLGADTLLLSPSLDTVAAMPCNCSIGGPAKAHLVREIDALGGEMARNIDRTYTHIRLLNGSKGPAVQALRAQADKALYRREMMRVLEAQPHLRLVQDTVIDIIAEAGAVCGVTCQSGLRVGARAIVVATGTFLNGEIHIGGERLAAGRAGEAPSTDLGAGLARLGLELRRFKTGTVPRVLYQTLDFEELAVQPSEARPWRFALEPIARPSLPLLPCHITATNQATHEILRRNASRSALWSGRIVGVGPRYCPSIEAKLLRFPDRQSHLVFLEQEGWGTEEVYVQGVSNSMPAEVQLAMLHSMAGLRRCHMTRPGYAIEYDCIDARALNHELGFPEVPGLYLAGQINGTSGYEEAAAQGLVAGVNAARWVQGRDGFRPGRTDGYLGVLIDDLTTKGTDEPYRMLTSRAEFRLLFGQDTAWHRLLPLAARIGLVAADRLAILAEERRMVEAQRAEVGEVGEEWLRRAPLSPAAQAYARSLREYDPYVRRERVRVRRLAGLERMVIPSGFGYAGLPLRAEARERLERAAPRTLGELAGIGGITPADVATVQAVLTRGMAAAACAERGGGEGGECFT